MSYKHVDTQLEARWTRLADVIDFLVKVFSGQDYTAKFLRGELNASVLYC